MVQAERRGAVPITGSQSDSYMFLVEHQTSALRVGISKFETQTVRLPGRIRHARPCDLKVLLDQLSAWGCGCADSFFQSRMWTFISRSELPECGPQGLPQDIGLGPGARDLGRHRFALGIGPLDRHLTDSVAQLARPHREIKQ